MPNHPSRSRSSLSLAVVSAALMLAACNRSPPPPVPMPKWQAQPSTQAAPQQAPPDQTPPSDAAAQAPPTTVPHTKPSELFEHMLAGSGLANQPAARPIPQETARSAIGAMSQVRSVIWLDPANLMVRVAGAGQRSHQILHEVCYQLQALGDARAVTVHLQNADAADRRQMDTLSGTCGLAPGQATAQSRQVDVLDPALRAKVRVDSERAAREQPPARSAGDRKALQAIPEI